MALPIPFRVQTQGASNDGPRGAIPIALYGASGGGGPVAIDDVTGLSAALDSRIVGLNGATGLWIGSSAELPAEADRLATVVYVVAGA